MGLSTNWSSLMNATGSMREQSRREPDGSKHRETASINREIAADCGPNPRSNTPSIDKARIKAIIKDESKRRMHNDIMQRFGPRLVRKDGTALYRFQCKK